MPNTQAAQVVSEVLRTGAGGTGSTAQVAVEVLRQHGTHKPPTWSAQVTVETLRSASPIVKGAQVALEVLRTHWQMPEPVYVEEYRVLKCRATRNEVRLTLGIRAPLHLQFPRFRYSRKLCRWFRISECPYALTCSKTLAECIDNGQTLRFGGFPAIPGGIFDA